MLDAKWHGMVYDHPTVVAAVEAGTVGAELDTIITAIPDAEALPLVQSYFVSATRRREEVELSPIRVKLLEEEAGLAGLNGVVLAEALRVRGSAAPFNQSVLLDNVAAAMSVSGGAAVSIMLVGFDAVAAEFGEIIGRNENTVGLIEQALTLAEAEAAFLAGVVAAVAG